MNNSICKHVQVDKAGMTICVYEPRHEISNNVVCATNNASGQPLLVVCIFFECLATD